MLAHYSIYWRLLNYATATAAAAYTYNLCLYLTMNAVYIIFNCIMHYCTSFHLTSLFNVSYYYDYDNDNDIGTDSYFSLNDDQVQGRASSTRQRVGALVDVLRQRGLLIGFDKVSV